MKNRGNLKSMKIEIPVFAIYLALTITASAVSAQEPGIDIGHRDNTQNVVKPLPSEESSAQGRASAKPSQGNSARSTFSSAEIVKQFQDNRSVFHNNYRGKVLQVSGSVWTFYKRQENPPGINVMLSGMTRKNPNDDQDSDNVCCETTAPKAISSAADLELGKNIVVRGLYDPNLRANGVESQIILHDCQLR
jgi:hypothetical protein